MTMKISKTSSFVCAGVLSIFLAGCGGSNAPDGAVSGTLSGLNTGLTLTLQNNGADNITLSANGVFAFPAKIASLGAFNVSVLTQPIGQTCAVTRPTGVIPTDGNQANITTVACAANTLGVNVSGLAAGTTVTLGNAGAQIVVNANGVSSFPGILVANTAYAVTINAQTTPQACTLSSASGTTAAGAQSLANLSCL